MIREPLARASTLVAVFAGLLWSHAADAQSWPPPIRPSVDENGVELTSGALRLTRTDIVVGQPGAGGLSFGGIGSVTDVDWYRGAITTAPNGPSTTTYTVSVGGYAESFDKANTPSTSPFVSVQGRGSTLTQNASNYTYTSSDGTVATFSKSLTQVGQRIAVAHVVQLKLPDGEIRSYNYVQGTVTAPLHSITRLQSVNNNRGYQISLTYFDDRLTIPSTDENDWFRLSGAKGINLSVDYCSPTANTCTGLTQSWPTVSYGPIWPLTHIVTDQLGNTTNYAWGGGGGSGETLSVRWPGSQSDDVVYTFTEDLSTVVSVNRRGRIWTYSRTANATERTVTVTDPQNRQTVYVFDTTKGSIKSFTNTAGEVTAYQNDAKGRPEIVTLPTGETIRYQYDARGNVTEVRRTSFPAGTDLVSTAGYDSTCSASTAKKCNKPNWTRDAAGNQTDYVYATAHGNPTSITLPAPVVGGIRPATSYTFTALQAYYKNSSGSIVAAGTNVYYLTQVAQCRQTSGCSASSADQLRTEISYGVTNVANNRLPVQTTVRNGSGTLIGRTDLQYDGVGNLVGVDGPHAGIVDKTVTRYDALRRVVGTVGPDPDDTGSRLNIGVRTTYDSRGLPALVETGNLPGQADASWTSFVPDISVVREFDAERRMTKESSVAGATTHAVQQVSFDSFGRVECRATRMNPAYFGALPSSACSATSDGPFGPDRIVRYGYDNADRVTSVTSGYGHPSAIAVQTMTYLTGGRLATLSDGKGNKTTYEYDGFGRLYRTYFPHPSTVGTSSTTDYEEYGYNVNSQVTSTRRRSGVVIGTARDALGRVTLKDVPATAEDVYFAYDNQGRVLSARYGSTSGSGIVQTYDGLGRLSTRTVFGRQLSYQYDLLGRRTRLTYPDAFYVTYGYSNVDELTTVTDSTGATLATYAYDGLGARTSITRPNGALTTYVPDAVKRMQELRQDLSGTSFDLTETFAYNPAGQISNKTVSNDAAYTAVPSPLTSTTTAVPDGQNQLTQFAGSTITDDANGNVWTGLGSLSYTYDALGQLRQAAGGANTVLVDYDPEGMLRSVQVGSTTTDYLYDGGDLVAQYNGATLQRKFVHGAGADEPLVVYEGTGTANKSWLHADERGSIIAATNASGVAASSVKYRPDGDSGTLASAFGYAGQLYLPELQLYYYKARMYSPKAGRFLQPDPIGYAGGMNLYSYVGNDPVNRTDPSGLCELRDVWTYVHRRGGDGVGEDVWTMRQEGIEDCLREFFRGYEQNQQAQQNPGQGPGQGPGTGQTSAAPQPVQGQWPVPGHCSLTAARPSVRQGAGEYGSRRVGANGRLTTHEGIDIAAPVGSQVIAAFDGRVVAVQPNPSSTYGNQVVLSVAGVGYLQYAHLRDPSLVKSGVFVSAGTPLGYVGRTGNVLAGADSHLHFEWRLGPGPFSPVADPFSIPYFFGRC